MVWPWSRRWPAAFPSYELCALYPASALVDFPGEAACDALVGMANGRVAAKPFHAMSVAAMCDAYLALYGRLLSKEGRTD